MCTTIGASVRRTRVWSVGYHTKRSQTAQLVDNETKVAGRVHWAASQKRAVQRGPSLLRVPGVAEPVHRMYDWTD